MAKTNKINNTPIQATIFDVARMCNVSRGTVDRVIHNRGRVSQDTVDKVKRAIEILGYSPNLNASILASKKTYTFACLIPGFEHGEYWEKIHEGFIAGANSLYNYNIEVDFHFYDQTNPESYIRCTDDILASRPHGVIMNTTFKEETIRFAGMLDEAGIPFAFVDDKFDGLNYTVYYGMDPYKSGRLGAILLTNHFNPDELLLVRLIRDTNHKADPNAKRRQGFLDYISMKFPECRIHTVFINPTDPQQIYVTLKDFFANNPDVKHLIMINSRIFLIDEYLRENPDTKRVVVGFDDIEPNLASLRSGHIEFLVTRHISSQSRLALTSFAECVIRGVKPQKRDNFLHMDILHRLNMDDY